jgi:hypothetical protein
MMTRGEKDEWMDIHIPSRFLAAMAHTELQTEQDCRPLDTYARPAVHMGRLAAIRWLIEFVGIKESKGQVVECKPKEGFPDTRIDRLDGRLLSRNSLEAKELAKAWTAISQAIAHPTHASGHSSLELPVIVPAVKILKDHIQANLYDLFHRDLLSSMKGLADCRNA